MADAALRMLVRIALADELLGVDGFLSQRSDQAARAVAQKFQTLTQTPKES